MISFQENATKILVCSISAILFRPQCIKLQANKFYLVSWEIKAAMFIKETTESMEGFCFSQESTYDSHKDY